MLTPWARSGSRTAIFTYAAKFIVLRSPRTRIYPKIPKNPIFFSADFQLNAAMESILIGESIDNDDFWENCFNENCKKADLGFSGIEEPESIKKS